MNRPKHSFDQMACRRQSGVAIALILVAVALMASLGAAIYAASHTQLGNDSTFPRRSATAAALIAQAHAIREGIDLMTGRGLAIQNLTFDSSSNTGLFNPSTGTIEKQIPVRDGLSQTSNWVWKANGSGNPVVKLYNYGNSSTADYVVALPYIDIYTCTAINKTLWNDPGIYTLKAGTATDWTTPGNSVDLSASTSGTQGRSEGCFWDKNSTEAVYIVGVRPE